MALWRCPLAPRYAFWILTCLLYCSLDYMTPRYFCSCCTYSLQLYPVMVTDSCWVCSVPTVTIPRPRLVRFWIYNTQPVLRFHACSNLHISCSYYVNPVRFVTVGFHTLVTVHTTHVAGRLRGALRYSYTHCCARYRIHGYSWTGRLTDSTQLPHAVTVPCHVGTHAHYADGPAPVDCTIRLVNG